MLFRRKQSDPDPNKAVNKIIDNLKITETKQLIALMKHIIVELDFRDENEAENDAIDF
jgi:hypothetical protein